MKTDGMTRRTALWRASVWTAAIAAGVGFNLAAHAQQGDVKGRLNVVTSFNKQVTAPFKAAFEKAYPGVTVDMQNRNTNAAVRMIGETKGNNQTDIMWASAPDAFEVLKTQGLLEKYAPQATGVAKTIGPYTVNDPENFYFGFAASGYGIMWNERYLRANRLPEPKEWIDLAKAPYFDHVMITAPSRSGTTHLTIETILQGEGWDKGWATIKAVSGNMRTISDRSFGVPDAVNSGQVGLGVVIDFFAFSAKAAGFPVNFVYPTVSTIVPANIAIVKNPANGAAARAFVDFVLSPQGQELLLLKDIARLPVNPEIYAKAPAGYPNPFKGSVGMPGFKFDVSVSGARYRPVGALFDQLITFNLEPLKKATKAIHDAEAALAKKDNAQARKLVADARALINAMPVTADQAKGGEVTGAFKGGSAKEKAPRQAELEQQWSAFARANYEKAAAAAAEALRLAR